MKNKSYIGISFIILIFGIYAIPRIVERIKKGDVVRNERLDQAAPSKSTDKSLTLIGPAPKFTLINHNGDTISDTSFKGKVYVVEFFFTTCPSICPKMNMNMLEIEKVFFGNPNFGIASISIDPETDTPEVLKQNAKQLGVKSSNWHFLTGDKQYIFDIANKGFNLYAGQNKAVDGGFEHSGLFALIDKNGNIRCRKDEYGNPILYYDGLEKPGVEALMKDIKILLNE